MRNGKLCPAVNSFHLLWHGRANAEAVSAGRRNLADKFNVKEKDRHSVYGPFKRLNGKGAVIDGAFYYSV